MQVTKVRVTSLVGNTYFARVHLSPSGRNGSTQEVDIDARPSDAINLAVRFNAPVYVSKQVLLQKLQKGRQNLPLSCWLKALDCVKTCCIEGLTVLRDCDSLAKVRHLGMQFACGIQGTKGKLTSCMLLCMHSYAPECKLRLILVFYNILCHREGTAVLTYESAKHCTGGQQDGQLCAAVC